MESLLEKYKGKKVSIGDLISSFNERGFSFILLICGILTTVVVAPLTLVAGMLPLMFAFQMLRGDKVPTVPKFLSNRKIEYKTLKLMVEKANRIIKWLETKMRVRLGIVTTKFGERFMGVMCLICALSIMIPLPFTNLIPALGVAIMSIGFIGRDGLVVLAGWLIGLIGSLIGFGLLISSLIAAEKGISSL